MPIVLPTDDDELLAQCEVQTFRSRGPGGQHVNTTDSAVRLRHLPSGLTVVCRDSRSQYRNKLGCLAKLRSESARQNARQKPRVPTRMSGRVRRAIRRKKEHRAEKKRRRRLNVEPE